MEKDEMKKSLLIGPMLFTMYVGSAFAIGLPPGSYTQTCTNASLQGETLTATCKRFNGSTTKTELPFATSCVGIISNVDGNLACTGPTGSFARTCKNARVENHELFATCQRINGSWKNSSTTFSGFQHPVTNCDGNLVDKPNC
jgi:hypothetical protein